ncbi:GNAT family N-acetyltransferase [Croceicoccus mobilis]|uniref:GNAT family acetyltransferase n=1 Tax=Croceicoccus mobilis TaxID=1703339 RepID=A0A916Z8H6_9SPHN|nr:GNAT family N-acetyltransferase [Croceicoccus mobilis]GGD79700.1 GNAT family acetyltransferase [Croceicoccus mobilis]
MAIAIRALTGGELLQAVEALAALRIAVFAEYPYLYDGDPAYEARYVREFIAEPGSVLVAALDGDDIVGVATASPMSSQKEEFRRPFEERGIATANLFYFGESVLLPEYRGQGVGHSFFDAREGHARAAGADSTCFASVIRPADHPARPADYRPHDRFWTNRGYAPVEGLTTELSWKDRGEAQETAKPMQYWMKRF